MSVLHAVVLMRRAESSRQEWGGSTASLRRCCNRNRREALQHPHLLCVEAAVLAGEALADYLGVFVNKHSRLRGLQRRAKRSRPCQQQQARDVRGRSSGPALQQLPAHRPPPLLGRPGCVIIDAHRGHAATTLLADSRLCRRRQRCQHGPASSRQQV